MLGQQVITRETLHEALHRLGALAYAEGKTVEIAVYGGAALMLTYDWRIATRDVDAVFEADKSSVRRLAAVVAEERGWDADWLNDGVKGFLSLHDPVSKALLGTFPSEDAPGLRVFTANPAYLFAMKCRAMRIGGIEASSDVADIKALAQELKITQPTEALDVIAAFYPKSIIEPKTQYGIEEILQNLSEERESSGLSHE